MNEEGRGEINGGDNQQFPINTRKLITPSADVGEKIMKSVMTHLTLTRFLSNSFNNTVSENINKNKEVKKNIRLDIVSPSVTLSCVFIAPKK